MAGSGQNTQVNLMAKIHNSMLEIRTPILIFAVP